MSRSTRAWLGLAASVACAGSGRAGAAEPPMELIAAGFFGTAEDDDVQGACAAPDGTLYLAGNAGAPLRDLPGGVPTKTFGDAMAEPKCGGGFVLRLSADARKILDCVQFAPGIAIVTTVQANDQGVYVGGYASEGLEPLLQDRGGAIAKYPLAEQIRLIREGKIVEANAFWEKVKVTEGGEIVEKKALKKEDPLANRPGLGRSGAPFVMRFSHDLRTLNGGTYLEGWQQIWDKHRQIGRTKEKKAVMMPVEHFFQPTLLALLKSGDVVVCHDGGYFRLLTDKDREGAAGNLEQLHRLAFYDVCDYLSLLSPDLTRRAYRKEIYTPATDLETAKRLKDGWPYPHYSNPRTLRMRLDKEEKLTLCGWSASATSREPWWSPYIWELNPRDGSLIRKIRETDPMSGGDNRMGGAVADAAIGSIAIEDDGHLVYGRYSDGGFSGVIHFSGSIRRVDLKTLQEPESVKTMPCVWTVDLAALPRKHLLALGRCNGKVDWTEDAWRKGDPDENPEGWLRVYDPKLALRFSTALRGIVPYELVPIGRDRYLVVGQSFHDTAQVKDALFDKPRGKRDGYYLIAAWRGP
jgi:hypothetical protein